MQTKITKILCSFLKGKFSFSSQSSVLGFTSRPILTKRESEKPKALRSLELLLSPLPKPSSILVRLKTTLTSLPTRLTPFVTRFSSKQNLYPSYLKIRPILSLLLLLTLAFANVFISTQNVSAHKGSLQKLKALKQRIEDYNQEEVDNSLLTSLFSPPSAQAATPEDQDKTEEKPSFFQRILNFFRSSGKKAIRTPEETASPHYIISEEEPDLEGVGGEELSLPSPKLILSETQEVPSSNTDQITLEYVTANGASTTQDLSFRGGVAFGSGIQVSELAQFEKSADIRERLTVGTLATFEGDTLTQQDATIYGSATVNQDLTVGTKDLYVDTETDRIGIGTKYPKQKLDVAGNLKVGKNLLVVDEAHLYNNLLVDGYTVLTGILNANGGIEVDGDRFTVDGRTGDVTTKRAMTVEGQATFQGNADLTGNLLPGADNTYSLGSSLYRWKDLYLGPASIKIYNSIGSNAEYMAFGFDSNVARLNITRDGSGTYRPFAINQNGSEVMRLINGRVGIGTTNPLYTLDVNGDGRLQGGELYLSGIDSSSSTTEGTLYYDTDDDQLKVYANGKWQADRSTATLIVAANDSQNKEKADYVCDGTNDEVDIGNAITAAGTGTITLLEGTYSIDSNLTIPTGITLSFTNSAKLNISNGVTVTFNGPIQAGLHQIFSGAGSVSIASGTTIYLYPQWWGAVGDGITDDSTALQNAINAGDMIYLPSGDYLISSSITAQGKVIKGEGIDKSRIITNDNDIDMLLPDQSRIYDMAIRGSGVAGTGSGIYLDSYGLVDFYNVRVSKCQNGVKIRNAWDISFYSCEFGGSSESDSNLQNDIDIDASDPADQNSQIRIINSRFMSKMLSNYHLNLISSNVGIASGCTFAYTTTRPAIYLSNTFSWEFNGPSFEQVDYAFKASNSHFLVTTYSAVSVNGFLDPSSGTNNSIILIDDDDLQFISGPSYDVRFDAPDGFGSSFKISRKWGPSSDEDLLTVTSSGSPNYEQSYQWGASRAGSHSWYAGKSRAMTLDRNGYLGIGTTTPQSLFQIETPANSTSKYLQIDSEAGVPAAGDCDDASEQGRMIIDHTNNRLYICNQAAGRGWDSVDLTD